MIAQFSQIKIIFLPENTTSRLQPLDGGIIQNFKDKYRKRLVKYVLARIQEDASATQIFKGVDVLVAIPWLKETWKEITNLTIKNCFEKYSIKGENELMEVEEDDNLEFETLEKEFTTDISAAEYANFDKNVPVSESLIQEDASATQIFKGVDVLVAIPWLKETWKEITNLTIKNCFEKYSIKGENELMEVEEDDNLEFETLEKEFTTDISAAEYANFDKNVPVSESLINEFEIDWRQRVREDSINAIQNPEIASDQFEEISNNDGSNDESDQLEQGSMGFKEVFTMAKWTNALSLIIRAKICCLRSSKGLRAFN